MSTPDPGRLRAALLNLSPAQQAAAEALTNGATHSAAAEAADVARETVTRWAGHHPGFRAALNLYRSVLVVDQADRARRIRGKAPEGIEAELEAGTIDPLAVLRGVLPLTDCFTPARTADELLDAETARTRMNLRPSRSLAPLKSC